MKGSKTTSAVLINNYIYIFLFWQSKNTARQNLAIDSLLYILRLYIFLFGHFLWVWDGMVFT